MPARISDDRIREAYQWYMEKPNRTVKDAARHAGCGESAFLRGCLDLGLPRKPRVRVSRPTTYQQVLEAYRGGMGFYELVSEFHIYSERVLAILKDAGEVCPRCEILLRETAPFGVAVLKTGERMCQECVEEGGYPVDHWEAEPVERITDYAELAACYSCEGWR
jgi:hypothetical protein